MVFSGRANKQTATKWLESAHFGLRRYLAQAQTATQFARIAKFVGKFQKKSENVRTLPNASGIIWMHPNASKQVCVGPNGSECTPKP